MPEEESADLLSPADGILLFLYSKGGSFEGSKAELARRLERDASNVGRGLDELEAEGLIQEISGGAGYEVTKKGERRIDPLNFYIYPMAMVIAVFAFLAVAGTAQDFLAIPIPRYGLESLGLTGLAVCAVMYSILLQRSQKSLLRRSKKEKRKPRAIKSS